MEFLEKPPLNELVESIFGEEDLEHSDEEFTVADEILSYFGWSDRLDSANEDELMHYGMPRRSGRYPYGSGIDTNMVPISSQELKSLRKPVLLTLMIMVRPGPEIMR